MEGRVIWYKPGLQQGCLVSDSGTRFTFRTRGEDDTLQGGARVVFKVSERDGDLVGVNVRVTEPGLDPLARDPGRLAQEFHTLMGA
jgi:hypothetical protein